MIFSNITKNLENFQYNVVIANFYEIYNNFNNYVENKNVSSELIINSFGKMITI